MTMGFPVLFILALVLVGAGIFHWLRSREEKRTVAGQPRLSTWRLVLATIFGLVALFAGGCSMLFVPAAMQGDIYASPMAILIIGGIPFAVAAFIVWLSLRRGNG